VLKTAIIVSTVLASIALSEFAAQAPARTERVEVEGVHVTLEYRMRGWQR
jgi:hypothetical protein